MDAQPEPGWTIECRQVVELVTDYLESALDEATKAEFEAHLALCPDCSTYLEQMRVTLSTLGQIPLETLSDTTKHDLVAHFRTVTRG